MSFQRKIRRIRVASSKEARSKFTQKAFDKTPWEDRIAEKDRPDWSKFMCAVGLLTRDGKTGDFGPQIMQILGWDDGRMKAAMAEAQRNGALRG